MPIVAEQHPLKPSEEEDIEEETVKCIKAPDDGFMHKEETGAEGKEHVDNLFDMA